MRFFSSPKCPDQLLAPPRLLFNGYWVSFPGVKWPGHEVNHSYSSGAEVKNEWSYISAFPYAFMAWTGKTNACIV
jgi:hypothetical protein